MATEFPSYEAIAERAYLRFQARGGAEGFHLDDWFQAERELLDMQAAEDTATDPEPDDTPGEKEDDREEATPTRRVGLRRSYPRRAAG